MVDHNIFNFKHNAANLSGMSPLTSSMRSRSIRLRTHHLEPRQHELQRLGVGRLVGELGERARPREESWAGARRTPCRWSRTPEGMCYTVSVTRGFRAGAGDNERRQRWSEQWIASKASTLQIADDKCTLNFTGGYSGSCWRPQGRLGPLFLAYRSVYRTLLETP